jgi:acyl carrier protein
MAESLHAVVARVMEVDSATITDESSMENTEGWDSLRQVILVAEVERIYGVRLDFEQMMDATSVTALRDLLVSKGIRVGS